MSNEQDELGYPHFALIFIDREGNLRHQASQSVAHSRESILSPRVTDAFLRAVASSRGPNSSHSSLVESGAAVSPPQGTTGSRGPMPPQVTQIPHSTESQSVERQRQRRVVPVPQGPPMDPTMWPTQHPEPWPPQWSRQSPQTQRRQPWTEEISMTSTQKSLISITDKRSTRRYYDKVFQNLQQTNCRVLAKAYIKLVEPRKQVNYPYNGRKIVAGKTQQLDPDETKPPWWPAGVSHREPDHLPKAERIRLLVHLLCELRTSHGITARRLKEADQPIRRQITPSERLQIMDEFYEVREEEEKYEDGKTDGKTLISISRANLPDPVDKPSSQKSNSRRSTPTDDAGPSQERPSETMCIRSGPMRIPTPHNAFATGELSANLSPNLPLASSHSPTQYVKPELSLHPGMNTSQTSLSAASTSADLKRKRHCVEAGVPTSGAQNPLEFYAQAPVYMAPQPFMTEPYNHEIQGFQPQAHPSPSQQHPNQESFGEEMDSAGFPYYFQY
ncbi:hypothetical protein N7488_007194 [Penicillium malachiteum]|nr:hypothetical protein N7488_007194 [Penicillium malachiteum]